ncbi:MAG: adenylyl-sulfate kinase [Ardenticatenia bacterium]|nr:adenylyl-sulfate kinase [Ardenticatenia bacterium]
MAKIMSPGWVVWITGLPASGKTSLALSLRRRLNELGVSVAVLDSDELRPIFTPNPTFTHEERDRFYAALVELAHLLARYGVNVIVAATANRVAYRRMARRTLPLFAEVWTRCPPDVCRRRDQKGLYTAAERGDITTLPGVGAPYEVPEAADVVVDTARLSPEEAADIVLHTVPFLHRGIHPQEI